MVSTVQAAVLRQAERLLADIGTCCAADATVVYYPNDVVLEIFDAASYNFEKNACSRGDGFDPAFILCVNTIIPTVVVWRLLTPH